MPSAAATLSSGVIWKGKAPSALAQRTALLHAAALVTGVDSTGMGSDSICMPAAYDAVAQHATPVFTAVGPFWVLALLIISMIGNIIALSILVSWCCCCRATKAEGGSKVRNGATQSQTRYSWFASQPRFVPLPDREAGAWAE